ncbi:hypothetical protein MAHJHV61_13760 [Mycobacterium avium subsp. hominissuis]
MIAARRAGSARAQVTVGNAASYLNDHWSSYCEQAHSQGGLRRRASRRPALRAPSVTLPGPARAERHAGVTPEPDGHAGVTLAEGQTLAEG